MVNIAAKTASTVTTACKLARADKPVSHADAHAARVVLSKLVSAAIKDTTLAVASVAVGPNGQTSKRANWDRAVMAPVAVAYAVTGSKRGGAGLLPNGTPVPASQAAGGVAGHYRAAQAARVAARIARDGSNDGITVADGSVVTLPAVVVPATYAALAGSALAVLYRAWLQAAGAVADHDRSPVAAPAAPAAAAAT